jgi:hypothetical protein
MALDASGMAGSRGVGSSKFESELLVRPKEQRMHRLIATALLFVSLGVAADPLQDAKSLFERYGALEAAFDPAVADLYADDALIKNKRTYPTGEVRELTMPAKQYKQLVRQSMPIAKARGDYSKYSDVTYAEEGSGVRIAAKRYSVLKQYSSPLSLLVTPDETGKWSIREELSESQP